LYGAILSFVSCACEQGCIMTSKLCLWLLFKFIFKVRTSLKLL
jgi:hypothetical protein